MGLAAVSVYHIHLYLDFMPAHQQKEAWMRYIAIQRVVPKKQEVLPKPSLHGIVIADCHIYQPELARGRIDSCCKVKIYIVTHELNRTVCW